MSWSEAYDVGEDDSLATIRFGGRDESEMTLEEKEKMEHDHNSR